MLNIVKAKERWQQPFRNVPVHAEWISVWYNGGVQWSVEEPKFVGHIWLTEDGQQGCLQWIDLPSDCSKAIRRVLPEERMVERVKIVKQVIELIDQAAHFLAPNPNPVEYQSDPGLFEMHAHNNGLALEKLATIKALMVHARFQWGGV